MLSSPCRARRATRRSRRAVRREAARRRRGTAGAPAERSPCSLNAPVPAATIARASSERRLEHALAHEDEPEAQHHDQPLPAEVAGREDDDVVLPHLPELLLETVATEHRPDELRQDHVR